MLWFSGYKYFNKVRTKTLRKFKFCLQSLMSLRRYEALPMILDENKACHTSVSQ